MAYTPIITICGSTRFKTGFEEAAKYLTANGVIVLTVGWFGHCEVDGIPDAVKKEVGQLHFRKIEISDAILDESTRNEIEHAKRFGVRSYYLFDNNEHKGIEYYTLVASELKSIGTNK
jgi:hypothetical protein